MTSNSPDSLDAALLRPGRIDSKVLFGYTNKEVSAQIFLHIFTKTSDEIVSASKREKEYEQEDNPSSTAHPSPTTLLAMSQTFAASIPETKISPAEIQGFLMRHRDDPASAVAHAAAWAKETLAVKKRGKNVAAFDNEIKRGGALFAGRGTATPPTRPNSPELRAWRAQFDQQQQDDDSALSGSELKEFERTDHGFNPVENGDHGGGVNGGASHHGGNDGPPRQRRASEV
jgi:hypothetical protein